MVVGLSTYHTIYSHVEGCDTLSIGLLITRQLLLDMYTICVYRVKTQNAAKRANVHSNDDPFFQHCAVGSTLDIYAVQGIGFHETDERETLEGGTKGSD